MEASAYSNEFDATLLMFQGLKGWRALLLLLLVSSAQAADDLNAAALSLAKKTAAMAGRGDAVAVTYRNLSSLAPADWSGLRGAFEAALRDAGSRAAESGAVEARLTITETPAQFLLVEEARHGDDRQVWMASWNRTAGASTKPAGIALQVAEVWRQSEQILGVACFAGGMLVLTPAKLTLYSKTNDAWAPRESASIANAKSWPRDLRGHVRTTGLN